MNHSAYTSRAVLATSRAVLAISGAAVALASGGCGSSSSPASKTQASAPTKLTGIVTATGQVTLETANGQPVTRLPSGWYSVLVRVNSTHEDFHLIGPSVDRTTTGNTPSLTLWGIQFGKGTYRYMSDRNPRAAARVFSVY